MMSALPSNMAFFGPTRLPCLPLGCILYNWLKAETTGKVATAWRRLWRAGVRQVTRLPSLCMACFGNGPLRIVKVIKLIIGCQWQWRAGLSLSLAQTWSRVSIARDMFLSIEPKPWIQV